MFIFSLAFTIGMYSRARDGNTQVSVNVMLHTIKGLCSTACNRMATETCLREHAPDCKTCETLKMFKGV